MIRLHVSNMSCGGCAKGVTRAVQSAAEGAKVEVNLSTREVLIDGASDEVALVEALRRAGYQAEARLAPAA